MISAKTAADLAEVARFFGIDMTWNAHLFRMAASADGRAFDVVIQALADAVRLDARCGATERIRQSIARDKALAAKAQAAKK